MIQTAEREIAISLSNITTESCLRNITESIASWTNVYDYLSSYMILVKSKYIKKGAVAVPTTVPKAIEEEEEPAKDKGKTRKKAPTKKAVTKKAGL